MLVDAFFCLGEDETVDYLVLHYETVRFFSNFYSPVLV